MEKQVDKMTIPQIVRGNTIIWGALIAGCLMMGMVLFFMTHKYSGFYDQSRFLNSFFTWIAVGIAISAYWGGEMVYRKKKEGIPKLSGAKEKVVHFRESFILKAAMLEGSTLISIIFMFLEKNVYFLGIAAILLVAQFLNRPTLERFKNDYQLTTSEKQELQNVGLVL